MSPSHLAMCILESFPSKHHKRKRQAFKVAGRFDFFQRIKHLVFGVFGAWIHDYVIISIYIVYIYIPVCRRPCQDDKHDHDSKSQSTEMGHWLVKKCSQEGLRNAQVAEDWPIKVDSRPVQWTQRNSLGCPFRSIKSRLSDPAHLYVPPESHGGFD